MHLAWPPRTADLDVETGTISVRPSYTYEAESERRAGHEAHTVIVVHAPVARASEAAGRSLGAVVAVEADRDGGGVRLSVHEELAAMSGPPVGPGALSVTAGVVVDFAFAD
jgi:uncharacterized protein YggE